MSNWSAQIVNIEPDPKNNLVFRVLIRYTRKDDPSQTVDYTQDGVPNPKNPEMMRALVANFAAQLDAKDGVESDPPIGPFNFEPTPPDPPDPAIQQKIADLQAAIRTKNQLDRAVALGALRSDDSSIAAATQAIQSLFQKDPAFFLANIG